MWFERYLLIVSNQASVCFGSDSSPGFAAKGARRNSGLRPTAQCEEFRNPIHVGNLLGYRRSAPEVIPPAEPIQTGLLPENWTNIPGDGHSGSLVWRG